MEKEVVVTYETIFEILRREKARDELQPLPENFSSEVKKYLDDKKQSTLSISEDAFAEIEQEKVHRQIINIKKLLSELYERREKKIVMMALSKSRVPKSIIDISALTPSEKIFYEKLLSTMNEARSTALSCIINENQAIQDEKRADERENSNLPEKDEEKAQKKMPDAVKRVRFVCDVSQFVGPNLEIYGPFRANDIATLPVAVCNVLINKKKAELDDES